MARLGYARVSLADQNTDLQIRELKQLGVSESKKTRGSAGPG